MPNTLIPIQTVTVGVGGASSIDFTNIPQNYTDLALKISGRVSYAATAVGIQFGFNGQAAGTSITGKTIQGSGSAASTYSAWQPNINGASATSNTFGSVEIYIPNYTSSANKSISSESVQEDNSSTAYAELHSALWSNTSVITRITITPNSGSFVQNSTATLYGISNGVKATGGTLTVAGGYAYHTFTSTGSFLPSQQIKGAEVLVIAGGGGSGDYFGAGGGAGGVAYANSQIFNAGNSYTAIIGSGGNGKATGTSARGDSGTNSTFSSFTAVGGGGGGGGANTDGLSGGSGGGGSGNTKVGGSSTQTSGTNYIGYGYAGGNAGSNNAGGGGGGAGAVGGAGGAGLSFGGNGISLFSTWHSITGTGVLSGGVYYIAGGGSASNISPGGLGGGGAGGVSGTANTGGGGGGQTSSSTGNGGSGLIIVRYPLT